MAKLKCRLRYCTKWFKEDEFKDNFLLLMQASRSVEDSCMRHNRHLKNTQGKYFIAELVKSLSQNVIFNTPTLNDYGWNSCNIELSSYGLTYTTSGGITFGFSRRPEADRCAGEDTFTKETMRIFIYVLKGSSLERSVLNVMKPILDLEATEEEQDDNPNFLYVNKSVSVPSFKYLQNNSGIRVKVKMRTRGYETEEALVCCGREDALDHGLEDSESNRFSDDTVILLFDDGHYFRIDDEYNYERYFVEDFILDLYEVRGEVVGW